MPSGAGKHRAESTPDETEKRKKRRKLGARKRGMMMRSKGSGGVTYKST